MYDGTVQLFFMLHSAIMYDVWHCTVILYDGTVHLFFMMALYSYSLCFTVPLCMMYGTV